MRVAIITSVSGKSARELAEHLIEHGIEAKVFYPFKHDGTNYQGWDYVLSYGCSAATVGGIRLNQPGSVAACIDKPTTFKAFKAAQVPTVRHWLSKEHIPEEVESLVIRKEVNGRKAEGLSYWDKGDGPVPDGELYSEWYASDRELRVTYVFGQVFVYRKTTLEGGLGQEFRPTRSWVYTKVKEAAVRAARGLQMDFVSFDVLYNSPEEFVFLEANSGTILTNEASTAIVEYFLNKE